MDGDAVQSESHFQFSSVRTLVLPGGRTPPRQQRSRHHHSFRGSFSAGSTPIFASKHAFFSIFQDLQEYHLLASKFAKFLRSLSEFCKHFGIFLENSKESDFFFKILQILHRIFTDFCRISPSPLWAFEVLRGLKSLKEKMEQYKNRTKEARVVSSRRAAV